MLNLKMTSAIVCDEFTLYDVVGDLNGSIEVQFDNGKFNGIIFFSKNGQEFGEEEWEELEDKRLYDYIAKKAIKDYNGIK